MVFGSGSALREEKAERGHKSHWLRPESRGTRAPHTAYHQVSCPADGQLEIIPRSFLRTRRVLFSLFRSSSHHAGLLTRRRFEPGPGACSGITISTLSDVTSVTPANSTHTARRCDMISNHYFFFFSKIFGAYPSVWLVLFKTITNKWYNRFVRATDTRPIPRNNIYTLSSMVKRLAALKKKKNLKIREHLYISKQFIICA